MKSIENPGNQKNRFWVVDARNGECPAIVEDHCAGRTFLSSIRVNMVLFPIFFEMTPISPLDILVKIVTSDSLVRFVTSIRWIFPSVFRAETVAD
jgi:hypothetical protein